MTRQYPHIPQPTDEQLKAWSNPQPIPIEDSSDWRSKVFVPDFSYYEHPGWSIEKKIAYFVQTIAPSPKTSNDYKQLEEHIKGFTKLIQTHTRRSKLEGRYEAFEDVIKNSVRCYGHDAVQVETPRTYLVTERNKAEEQLKSKEGEQL